MFCAQCGSQLVDGSKFCYKCGAPTAHAAAQTSEQPQAQSASAQPKIQPESQAAPAQALTQTQQTSSQQIPAQPQVQPQAGQVVYVQSQVQPQGGQVYVQPQVQPQAGQVYVQPQVQPQAGQVVYVQPQTGQVYGQSQPQQVYVQPQAQTGAQGQQVYVQPQAQTVAQPQQATASSGVQDALTAPAPKKKKKGAAGVVIGIIAAVAAVVLLVVGAVKFGVFKSPKKLFAENVVGVFKNVNAELPNFGMTPAESILHLTVDDTKDSHTTTTTTTISAAEAGEYENLELVQSYSYDADKGNAAYDFSIASGGTPVSTGAIYFSGNDFIFTPMSVSEPMVHYTLDPDSVSNYKKLSAIDRYALMIQGSSKENEKDWKKVLADFSAETLKDIDKKQFFKSKEDAKVLGKIRKCQVAGVKVDNATAMTLINGIGDMVYSDVQNEEQKDEYNLFKELCTQYEQNGGNLELTAKTYSYKRKPVIVCLDADLSGVKYRYEIAFCEKGKEKELSLSSTVGDETTLYEESALSAGVGQYQYTTKYESPENSLLIEKKGLIVGNNRNVNGTITFTPREGLAGGSVPLDEESITGEINETVIMGKGTLSTIIRNGNKEYSIMTDISRDDLQSGKINPPEFLEESGTDCASLEELKAAIKIEQEDDIPEVNNSLVRLAEVYALFVRNGLMESIQND